MIESLKARGFKAAHGVYEVKRAARKEGIEQRLMVIKELVWGKLARAFSLGGGFQRALKRH